MADGAHAFNQTLQRSELWIEELQDLGKFNSKKQACSAFRAVLHVLRDYLTIAEAVQLANYFPIFLKGLYYDNWQPTCIPTGRCDVLVFKRRVEAILSNSKEQNLNPQKTMQAVVAWLKRKMPPDELTTMREKLPTPLNGLFD
jgi:uncharacterized protein (DUF2267 family)